MKKLKVSKEFILDLHKNPTPEKIEKEFPQLFELKQIENKWYIANCKGVKDDYLILSNGVKNECKAYIVSNSYIGGCGRFDFVKREATESEVKTALIAEAKKRGFKEGVKYEELHIKGRICEIKGNIKYHKSSEDLRNDGWCLFHNGKWATIIEQPTEMTLAEIEAKLGCKIKIVG